MKNKELFYEYASDIINHELFLQTKQIFSHGTISIFRHSLAVAERAFSMIEDEDSNKIDKKCVVRAALLHDFFLYEWHIPGMRYLVHGWAHPAIAAEKARDVFNISDKEYSCIRTHMWPWTLFHFPKYREGLVISLADKIVAMQETFLCRGKRERLKDPSAS
ncbi:MAG: HD domain-containing protein [Termitinemataceae bacterium]|nr:MAG: HD domain-containing protein [Termitinemataceae bacterium]